MASTSGTTRPFRPPSPPPPPPRRVKRQCKDVRKEQEHKFFSKKDQRRHGKGIYIVPADIPESSKEAKGRCNSVQDYQETDRTDMNELHFAAGELFLSNNALSYLSLVIDFGDSSVLHENPQSQVKDLWNFCARRFPNALSLMLARLLNLSLPSGIRIQAIDLLHLTLNRIHRNDRSCIDERVLRHLKPLLLNVIENRQSTSNLLNLSEVAARIFEIEKWHELLDYLLEALQSEFVAKQEIALRLLSALPEMREECLGAYKFWWRNRRSLNLIFCQLFGSPNLNIRALTFDASVKLVRLLHRWKFYGEIDDLLLRMIRFLRVFHRDGQTDIVEPRIMDLVELARNYTDQFLKQLGLVLDCMFQIAATADDNTFLKCQAIQIIKILDKQDMVQVSQFLHHEISNEAKRSIFENCVRLMFCVADVPAWYDIDMSASEYTGISGGYELGKFLLFRVCLDSEDDILVPFGIEMIPQYLNSQDWPIRHAGLIAFGAIKRACVPETMRDHAERMLDISLTDPHPRVRWAATEVIVCLITDSDKEHVQYLTKFVPKLVTVISSASIYPRIQFHAAMVIRLLITNCGDEEEVESYLEDLVPELLNFFKQGEKFQKEAMETLKSLAVSFPAIFRKYYQQINDSLKAFVSQTSGAKSIESLSNIFLGSLRQDLSLSLLNDAQKALPIVLRLVNNWTGNDPKVKILVLKALSALYKLPQLVVDDFLNTIMPVLIQILENTNPYTMRLTINEQNSTCSKQTFMACELLSKFAVRFQEQFAPWASRVSPLLTRLFSSNHPDAQLTSVRALPSILLSCQHRKEPERFLFNFTVQALVEQVQGEMNRTMGIEMLRSLNECIQISGTVFDVGLIKQIADQIKGVLSQTSFAKMEIEVGEEAELPPPNESDKQELEEEIIEAANCLVTMIDTLKSAFLTHVDELLPVVEALWGRDNDYPDSVKAVAISIFNLLLKDYPHKLQRYRYTYALIVMDACHSRSPQLQQEAARGIGLCATHREFISNFDAPVAIERLYHVIECGMESERAKTHDAAVSALGKICEFWRDTINGPQVVPIWLNFLPLRNDFEEAKYAHQQLCLMLGRFDQDLLGLNNENLSQAILILKGILSQSDYLATEATTCAIMSLLSQFGAMP